MRVQPQMIETDKIFKTIALPLCALRGLMFTVNIDKRCPYRHVIPTTKLFGNYEGKMNAKEELSGMEQGKRESH